METLVRIVDDEETVRNSEIFIFKLAGIPAAAYSSAEEFLGKLCKMLDSSQWPLET